jgi:hypothetical protein
MLTQIAIHNLTRSNFDLQSQRPVFSSTPQTSTTAQTRVRRSTAVLASSILVMAMALAPELSSSSTSLSRRSWTRTRIRFEAAMTRFLGRARSTITGCGWMFSPGAFRTTRCEMALEEGNEFNENQTMYIVRILHSSNI